MSSTTAFALNEFTAAAGPVVYRGDLFGKNYDFNAFVPEPSANLIKRNFLNEKGYVVKGDIAYKGREFLASTDERFRPVSLYNAPDGSMIVLDMYRGIIQHKTYLTPYLKDQIGKRDLTQPLSARPHLQDRAERFATQAGDDSGRRTGIGETARPPQRLGTRPCAAKTDRRQIQPDRTRAS